MSSASETVEGSALSLEGVDDVEGGDGLPLGVLGVCDCIPDDVFQENLENSTGFFVDQSRDTFHTASSSQSSDSGFGDTLDVITKNFSVTLGAAFSKSFTSFTTSRHLNLRKLDSEFNQYVKILQLQICRFSSP